MKSVYEFEENNIDDLENELSTEQNAHHRLIMDCANNIRNKKMLKIAAGKHHGTSNRAKWFLLKLLMWFLVFFSPYFFGMEDFICCRDEKGHYPSILSAREFR
jgi:hypothetical protein